MFLDISGASGNSTEKNIFGKMLDIIQDESKWFKGHLSDGPDRGRCILGHMYEIEGNINLDNYEPSNIVPNDILVDIRDEILEYSKILASIIKTDFPDVVFSDLDSLLNVTNFNDHYDTTIDDVRSLLKKADEIYATQMVNKLEKVM